MYRSWSWNSLVQLAASVSRISWFCKIHGFVRLIIVLQVSWFCETHGFSSWFCEIHGFHETHGFAKFIVLRPFFRADFASYVVLPTLWSRETHGFATFLYGWFCDLYFIVSQAYGFVSFFGASQTDFAALSLLFGPLTYFKEINK